jgi:hypothetical protein
MFKSPKIIPTQNNQSTGTTNLFLIALKAKKVQDDEIERTVKNRLYKETDSVFEEIKQFVLAESFDAEMLIAALNCKTSRHLKTIPIDNAYLYNNAHALCNTIITRINEIPELRNKITKDNKWLNSTISRYEKHDRLVGRYSYEGSIEIFIDFSPKPEPSPYPEADKPATGRWTCNLL